MKRKLRFHVFRMNCLKFFVILSVIFKGQAMCIYQKSYNMDCNQVLDFDGLYLSVLSSCGEYWDPQVGNPF